MSFEFRFVFTLSNILENIGLLSTNLFANFRDPNRTALSGLKLRLIRAFPYGNANTSLMQHLASILPFGCFKKGDLISIALNTSGLPLFFRGHGEINTEEDVIWVFSVLTLAAGDVLPLVTDGNRLIFPMTMARIPCPE